MQPARIVLAFLAVAWIGGIAIAGADDGHGTDSELVALPIERVEQIGSSDRYQLVVECADDIEVEVSEDHGGSDLIEVTVWGRPRIGRCHPEDAHIGVEGRFTNSIGRDDQGNLRTKFVDGATSQVVELS